MLKAILVTVILAIIVFILYKRRNGKITWGTYIAAEAAMWGILLAIGLLVMLVTAIANAF